jgi:hypothetical protein
VAASSANVLKNKTVQALIGSTRPAWRKSAIVACATQQRHTRRQAGFLGSTSFKSTGAMPKSAITTGSGALFITPS